MPTITCPHCHAEFRLRKVVDREITAPCPRCQNPIRVAPPPSPPDAASNHRGTYTGTMLGAGVCVLLAVILLAAGVGIWITTAPEPRITTHAPVDADPEEVIAPPAQDFRPNEVAEVAVSGVDMVEEVAVTSQTEDRIPQRTIPPETRTPPATAQEAAPETLTGEVKVERSYDRFRNRTTVSIELPLKTNRDGELALHVLEVGTTFDGEQGPGRANLDLGVMMSVYSPREAFYGNPQQHRLEILAHDNTPQAKDEHPLRVSLPFYSTGNGPSGMPNIMHQQVSFSESVDRELDVVLAKKHADFRFERTEFSFTDRDRDALRRLIAELDK